MKKAYNYFVRAILTTMAALVLLSCDKENNQPRLDVTLLYGKQWQLAKIMVNEKGQDFNDPVETCQQDDALEFKSDKIFIRNNGENKCSQEADSEVSQWSIFQEPKTLIFESIEYEILELKVSELNLQRRLQSIEGEVIVKYYYIAN